MAAMFLQSMEPDRALGAASHIVTVDKVSVVLQKGMIDIAVIQQHVFSEFFLSFYYRYILSTLLQHALITIPPTLISPPPSPQPLTSPSLPSIHNIKQVFIILPMPTRWYLPLASPDDRITPSSLPIQAHCNLPLALYLGINHTC